MSDQVIRVYESNDRYLIQNLQTNILISIHRSKNFIQMESVNILNNINIYKVSKSYGILGIINLNLFNYIISVTECKKIGRIGNTSIFQAQDVEFIQIDQKTEQKPFYNIDYVMYELTQILAGIRKIISEGVYFSRDFDLTNSLQTQKNIKISNGNYYDILKNSNKKFLFNEAILRPFFQSETISTDILVNSIYGYVKILKESINGKDFSYILISRKETFNISLDSFCMGFDEHGNISNCTETEQIFLLNSNAFSFVQIKSPPPAASKLVSEINSNVFDEEKARNFGINENLDFFKGHINNLNKFYRFIYIINLLNKINLHENLINNIIENNIKRTDNPNFKYNYYNFDTQCLQSQNLKESKGRDSIENFILGIENVLNIFKYFGVTHDSQNNKVLTDQVGILRIFCIDGLERSNIIEMRIGWFILEAQLKSIGISAEEFFGADIVSVKQYEKMGLESGEFLNNPKKKGIEFIVKFKKIWKENSQILGTLFTGINKSSGQIDNGNNHDYIQNLFEMDEYLRQNCLDLIMDKSQIMLNPVTDNEILKCLDDNFAEYCEVNNLLTYIGSYNLGGRDFKDNIDLLDWLLPYELKSLDKIPDIYIVGLQEIVELNASNILITSNTPKVDYWKSNLQANLEIIGKYQMIKCLDLVGVLMVIFVRGEILERIKHFDFLIHKTGMLGTMGNKGSCLMRFEIDDTSIAFSSGHFAAGQNSNNSRITELLEIISKNFSIHKSKKFSEHDIFFIFGDLNFRLDLDNNSVRRMIANKSLETLVVYDQFLKTRSVNYNLHVLDEGNLTYNPTYKYNFGSNEYDSKAKRIPSWCDRIFYKKTKLIKQICYCRSEYTYSDHKPVFSLFEINVLKEKKNEKKKLVKFFRRAMTFGLEMKLKIKKRGLLNVKNETNLGYNSKIGVSGHNIENFQGIHFENKQKGEERIFNPYHHTHINLLEIKSPVKQQIQNYQQNQSQIRNIQISNENNSIIERNPYIPNILEFDKIDLSKSIPQKELIKNNTQLIDLNYTETTSANEKKDLFGNLNINQQNFIQLKMNNYNNPNRLIDMMDLSKNDSVIDKNHSEVGKIKEDDIFSFFK